jgi:N6-adenosine-specific RNA methylase IME4
MKPEDMLDCKDLWLAAFPGPHIDFVWTTGPQLPFTMELYKHFGYTYRTKAFTWAKLNKRFIKRYNQFAKSVAEYPATDDEAVYLLESLFKPNNGHWTRSNPEMVLVFTKGKMTIDRKNKAVRELVLAPIGEHSQKPDEVNRRIDLLMGTELERFEFFARRQYPDWQCTGGDLDGLDIRVALQKIADGERWVTETPVNVMNHKSKKLKETKEQLDLWPSDVLEGTHVAGLD